MRATPVRITLTAALLALQFSSAWAGSPPPPDVVVFGEHEAEITHLALSPDGRTLVAASEDGAVVARDAQTGESTWGVEALKRGKISGLSVGIDFVYYTGTSADVDVLNLETGEREEAVETTVSSLTRLTSVTADPKGRWVWTGTRAGGLMRMIPGRRSGWSADDLENGGTTVLALSGGGDLVAAGGKSGLIRLAKTKSAQLDDKRILSGHTGAVTALCFVKNSKLLSASEDGTLRLWKVSSGSCTSVLESHEAISAVAVNKSGKLAVSGDFEGAVVVWDLLKGKKVTELDPDMDGAAVRALTFSRTGNDLVVACGKTLLKWDLSDL